MFWLIVICFYRLRIEDWDHCERRLRMATSEDRSSITINVLIAPTTLPPDPEDSCLEVAVFSGSFTGLYWTTKLAQTKVLSDWEVKFIKVHDWECHATSSYEGPFCGVQEMCQVQIPIWSLWFHLQPDAHWARCHSNGPLDANWWLCCSGPNIWKVIMSAEVEENFGFESLPWCDRRWSSIPKRGDQAWQARHS